MRKAEYLFVGELGDYLVREDYRACDKLRKERNEQRVMTEGHYAELPVIGVD